MVTIVSSGIRNVSVHWKIQGCLWDVATPGPQGCRHPRTVMVQLAFRVSTQFDGLALVSVLTYTILCHGFG